jgi:hypothetical protein
VEAFETFFDGDRGADAAAAGTLAGQAVQMCLSAAALHLGEPDDRGRRLAAPQPQAAWLAILATDALTDALVPYLDADTADGLGRSLGQLMATFAARYPTHQAPLPPTLTARLARDGEGPAAPKGPHRGPEGSEPLRVPLPAATPTPAKPTAPGTAPLASRLPCEPVNVDELVHRIFLAFIAVAGQHLGDPAPSGARLAAPDPAEAQLCLTLAGALYAHLFTLLGAEAGEHWRAELHAMLDRYEQAAPLNEQPVASLEAVAAAAWADVEAP